VAVRRLGHSVPQTFQRTPYHLTNFWLVVDD
jgi:hypothetical protein